MLDTQQGFEQIHIHIVFIIDKATPFHSYSGIIESQAGLKREKKQSSVEKTRLQSALRCTSVAKIPFRCQTEEAVVYMFDREIIINQ